MVRKYNIAGIIFGSLLILLSIAVFKQGMDTKSELKKFESKTEKTVALVKKIDNESDGSDKQIFVDYQVGEKIYSDVELGYSEDNIVEGKGIYIYYSKKNPEKLYQKIHNNTDDDILLICAIVMLVVGLVILYFVLGLSRKVTMKNKVMYEAEVTDIFLDYSVRINNRHPYKVDCKVYDSYTGQTMLFRSKCINRDLSNVKLKKVKVYVDEKNKKRYYVDVIGALEELKDDFIG